MTAPLTASASPAKSRRALLASYIVLNIATGTVGGAMQIAVPLYALSLHAATAQIGLIRGISGVGILLLVIPAGFLVDHFGSKRLFLLGGVLGTAATACLSLTAAPSSVALVMGLAGLFSALKMTALNSSFYSNLKEMGLDKAGWFKGSMSIGLTFVGPVLGGWLAQALAFETVFKVLALMTLVPIGLVFFFHNDPARHGGLADLAQSARCQVVDFRALLGNRELYLPLITESISTGFFATFSAFGVVIAVKELHLPSTAASSLLTVEGGLFILTVFLAGPLIEILSQLQLYLLSAATVITGVFWLVLAGSFPSIVAATVVLGLGLGLINLVTSSRVGRMKGEKGKIVGLFTAAVGIGASTGPMLGGVIGTWFGTRSAFLAYVPLFAGLAALAFIQDSQIKRGAQAAQFQRPIKAPTP